MGDTSFFLAGLLAVLLLAAPLAVADADDVRPVAIVKMSGPHEVLVEGGEGNEFQVHVASRIECASGLQPPRDLVVLLADPSSTGGEAALWRVEPASVRVPWQPSPGEPDVFIIDTLVSFNVTSEKVPEAPVEDATELLVQEARDSKPGLHCQVDGYDLDVEQYDVSFLVVPPGDDTAGTAAAEGREPPVRWVPMLLAVGILLALTLFATMRERQRRQA